MKPLEIIILLLFFFSKNNYAQDKLPIKFGKVTLQDFDVQSPLIDSNTNAVVVADVGNSEFIANTNELSFSLLFNQKKRVKIINKNGFDAATVTIFLYYVNNIQEKLQDLDAYTYNIENGKVVSAKVDKSSIFTETINDHWISKKFTFPAVKEGSIIEYDYEIKSDFFRNLHDWQFQDEYPTLWSQYDAAVPEFYKFVILTQGYQPFTVKKTERTRKSFAFVEHHEPTAGSNSLNSAISSTRERFTIEGAVDYNTWIMKNVPALKEESFTTTTRNAVAKIEFQLQQVAYPNQIPKDVMNDWGKVSEDLRNDERFGMLINRPNNWLDDDVAEIVKGALSDVDKAKKIYEYVRNNFTCTNYNRYLASSSLKEVMKNKSGTVADINMLLIAMLRTQNIAANPVLLSTRSHGYASEIYPLMDKYNYLLAKTSAGNDVYYLDAATPRLGFNKLAPKVYNGQARVITKESAEPVYFSADSLSEMNLTTVLISNNDKGAVEGAFLNMMGYMSSLDIRDDIARSGMEEYRKEIKASLPDDIELLEMQVDSLKKLDEPVALKYSFKMAGFGESDIVYFNPMLGEAIKKNPFVSAERFYPVEMPYTTNNTYTLTMDIPKGYAVEELPKSARIMLNEDEGMFEYLISADENMVQMRCKLVIKKTFFPNEDYQTLRDFYAYVVKKEAEQIVFKKTK